MKIFFVGSFDLLKSASFSVQAGGLFRGGKLVLKIIIFDRSLV